MSRRWRTLGPLLELIGLSGLAIAQPVFEDFRLGADTFVAYDAGRVDLVLFVLGVVLVVPLAVYLVELLAGLLGATWQRVVHAVAVVLLVFSLTAQAAKSETEMGWKRIAAIALAVGVAGAVAVWRWHGA